jgi:pimeloyl-ACP methyl ester carboxylesterase
LTVPEDCTDPESRNIRLAVAIFRHPDGNPQPDPIIYLEGGPGASPLELRAPNFAALFGSMFAAKRDIILIDPRGVGYSQPALDCPNFTQLYLDLLDFEIDGDRLSSQQVLDYKIDAFLTCAENLRSVADLSKYNTIASAAEVNDLRRALGYDQVNLWGTSYGSRLVQAMTGESYPMLLDGDRLLELALRSLYSTNLRPALPEAFYEASTGNFSPFLPVIWNDIQAQDLRSRGNYFSVLCNEEVSFIPWNQFQSAVAEYPEFIGMYAGSEMGGLVYGVCEGWGAGQAEARENEAVQSQVPALIMTGQYDPVALPDWGALIAKSLPNGHYFEIKGMAHGVSLADCPLDLLLAFLENPSMAPDDTCIAEMGSPQFVLPVEEEVLWEAFENEDFGIQGLVPAGWDEVSSGIFARASSPTDLTVLLMQAAPVSASEILNSLAAQIDVEEIPESLDVREANNLSWTLYTVESQGLFRDIALADQDGMTLFVILRTTPDKHDALFETIFLPAVDELVLEE